MARTALARSAWSIVLYFCCNLAAEMLYSRQNSVLPKLETIQPTGTAILTADLHPRSRRYHTVGTLHRTLRAGRTHKSRTASQQTHPPHTGDPSRKKGDKLHDGPPLPWRNSPLWLGTTADGAFWGINPKALLRTFQKECCRSPRSGRPPNFPLPMKLSGFRKAAFWDGCCLHEIRPYRCDLQWLSW